MVEKTGCGRQLIRNDRGLLKLHGDFEPELVAFEPILRAKLPQPFHFGCQAHLAELRGVGKLPSRAPLPLSPVVCVR
jgi:hypothetical protein